MKQKKKDKRKQAFFGAKCVLLAAAILMIAVSTILGYTNPALYARGVCTVVDIAALLIITLVMFFEVKPYLDLSDSGIRSIYREKDIEIENFGKFNRMLEKNSFQYHFQPIVNAKNGSIYAYEALMRSPKEIGLSPREILKYAEISQQLYGIEYFTFYNTLRIYRGNSEKFAGRKMFLNSIPSVTLSEKDLAQLQREFGDIGENTVVEILEDDQDTRDSCVYFEKLRKMFGCQIAIDDYGNGYSNEMKLLNNNPNYIKIDISLISSIDSDTKKQLLVSNIIKFASQYGIKVLAEGVETKEELQTLIELGVDLIQGFCCARPNPEILAEINPEIRDFIVEENIRCSRFDNDRRVYTASDGETISLLELAIKKYGRIYVESGTVTITGEAKHPIDITIATAPESDCTVILENANIISSAEGACVQIGPRGNLKLRLSGENTMNKEGILVPASSGLILCGNGNLVINGSRNNGVGIGNSLSEEFGSITIETEGKISIICSGDKIACVGGGKQVEDSAVRFLNGTIEIRGNGIQCVGVGSSHGSFCFTCTAFLNVNVSGNSVIGIGCLNGFPNLEISAGKVQIEAGGDQIAGIGAFNGENGRIALSGGKIEVIVRGKDAVCVGSLEGGLEILCSAEYINAIGEGTRVCGIGNGSSSGSLTIAGGTVRVNVLSAFPRWFGSVGKPVVITSGNILFNPMREPLNAVNSFGEPLLPETIDSNSFEKRLITPNSDYLYRAMKIPEADILQVFIPEGALTK